MSDDFFAEDESLEEFWAAWDRGEKGWTVGFKSLDPEAQEALDMTAEEMVERFRRGRPAHVYKTGATKTRTYYRSLEF